MDITGGAMTGERAEDRRVLRVTGADRVTFLQGLVTNDMRRLERGPLYAAVLTPQGKYLADFLMLTDPGAEGAIPIPGAEGAILIPGAEGAILIDVKEDLAEALMRRLQMYRLRADVQIAPTDLKVSRGLGTPPPGAVADPRHAALGWRLYGPDAGGAPQIDWDGIRVANCIPETGIELIPDQTFILEAGFERLSGVDHRKGCYVGQEVTARMKHKTELRKGLVTVEVTGPAEPGTAITAEGRGVGTLHTRSGDRAIAYLRFDRATGPMQAGEAAVRWADAETLA